MGRPVGDNKGIHFRVLECFAAETLTRKGKLQKRGEKKSRIVFSTYRGEGIQVAAKWDDKMTRWERLRSSLTHITLDVKDSKGGEARQLAICVNSLVKRLHMSRKEILQAHMKGNLEEHIKTHMQTHGKRIAALATLYESALDEQQEKRHVQGGLTREVLRKIVRTAFKESAKGVVGFTIEGFSSVVATRTFDQRHVVLYDWEGRGKTLGAGANNTIRSVGSLVSGIPQAVMWKPQASASIAELQKAEKAYLKQWEVCQRLKEKIKAAPKGKKEALDAQLEEEKVKYRTLLDKYRALCVPFLANQRLDAVNQRLFPDGEPVEGFAKPPRAIRWLGSEQEGRLDELYDGDMTQVGDKPSLHDLLDVCRQLTHGLHYAHARKVLHRDIKPGNILYRWVEGVLKAFIADLDDVAVLDRNGNPTVAISPFDEKKNLRHVGTTEYCASQDVTSINTFKGGHKKRKLLYESLEVSSLGLSLLQILTRNSSGHPFLPENKFYAELQEEEQARKTIADALENAGYKKEIGKGRFNELVTILTEMVVKNPSKRCSAKKAFQAFTAFCRELKKPASNEKY